jgi:aromatic-amino-acid transaminase
VDQWKQIVQICKAKQLIPFLDMAYQGFADNIDQDGAAVRLLPTQASASLFLAHSPSLSLCTASALVPYPSSLRAKMSQHA